MSTIDERRKAAEEKLRAAKDRLNEVALEALYGGGKAREVADAAQRQMDAARAELSMLNSLEDAVNPRPPLRPASER